MNSFFMAVNLIYMICSVLGVLLVPSGSLRERRPGKKQIF